MHTPRGVCGRSRRIICSALNKTAKFRFRLQTLLIYAVWILSSEYILLARNLCKYFKWLGKFHVHNRPLQNLLAGLPKVTNLREFMCALAG